jgi:large subunit ribosomal protein L3
MKSILGRKMGMTQVFADDGTMYPVTVVEVLPNVVLQVKTRETDGYEAIQVGVEDKKEHRANKAEKGIVAKANTAPKYEIAELKGKEMMKYQVGESITVDIFEEGELVDVIGTSKGHGFSGVVKRWNKALGPAAHGSGFHRQLGSHTNGLGYNRIFKGKKMAGNHGHKQATVLNLLVVKVLPEKNAILIKGAIPGPKKAMVIIRNAVKARTPKLEVKPIINRTAVAAPVEEQQ